MGASGSVSEPEPLKHVHNSSPKSYEPPVRIDKKDKTPSPPLSKLQKNLTPT